MKRERWQQVETLYHAALEHAPAERAIFLAQACASDSGLQREVEELLCCDEQAWSFIEDNAANVLARRLAPSELEAAPVVLLTGQQLGAYKILALLGRGGMGEVYRAHDARLERDVAIKVLPASYAHDPARLRRFEQEAHTTSALNHPNILTIYDIGQHDGTPYIVAELLEGENLRSQLDKGRLPPKKAVDYARQIVAGLAVAHDKGIVHRDLKPENLFVTKDGRVKILDFGLAKLKPPKLAGLVNADALTQPSKQQPLTNPGVVLGTVSYMAPEQVRGQEADQRSDIFAFGIIFFEMLSGRQPFLGGSAAEMMSAILKEEPPELGETNARVSASLERLVRHCLEKDPELRFQSARDLGFALEALSPTGSASHSIAIEQNAPATSNQTMPVYNWRKRLLWLSLPLVALLAVSFAWTYFTHSASLPAARKLKLALNPPDNASFDSFVLSPDGHWLAFTGVTGGKVQLWIRALDSNEIKVLPGTEGARFPFWSPDSQWLGYFGGSGLKKLAIAGGPAQTICDLVNPVGGTWNRDDVIVFGKIAGGLLRVPASGGKATQLMLPDLTRQERQYYFPQFLPDGRHFLYTVLGTNHEVEGIYLGSLDGKVKQRLLAEPSAAWYVSPGYLLFQRDKSLLAQGFDADKLQLQGEAVTVAERVAHDPVYVQLPMVSVSGNGLLAFDEYFNRQVKQLIWLDRSGKQLSVIDDWWPNTRPALAPDGKHFVADKRSSTTKSFDLFVSDLTGDNYWKFTFDPGTPRYPLWSPDGSRIFWTSTRADGFRFFQKSASGEGQDEQVLNFKGITNDISRDGRYIVFEYGYPQNQEDLWIQPLAEGQAPYPFQIAEGNQSVARFSPDGRWLAYVSTETGTREIYVQHFPEGGSKRQVSVNGGAGPVWRRDGKELFYYEPTGKLMAVSVVTGENLELGATVPLFEFRAGTFAPANSSYDVTADGQRFLVNAIVNTQPRAPLTIVVNWLAGVKK